MPVYQHTNRAILKLTGADRISFLQGMVSNNVRADDTDLVYAALLSPQGKYLIDFFLSQDGETVLLETHSDHADSLLKRLSMYKLRADVSLERADQTVTQIWDEPAPDGALPDPRAPALGCRLYGDAPAPTATDDDWTALRVAHMIPETGTELIPNDSYILEMGFERLNGVDFRKGCYVGQEVTARMKHKTELRKGLALVGLAGAAETGAEITANGKPAGTLLSIAGDTALAYLRFDRASGPMMADGAELRLLKRAV